MYNQIENLLKPDSINESRTGTYVLSVFYSEDITNLHQVQVFL